MHSKRELYAALLLGVVIIVFFTCMTSYVILTGSISPISLWGIPAGFLFGIATWFYLSDAWNPINLRPTNPEAPKANLRLLWIVVPLVLILGKILPSLIGENMTDLVVLSAIVWGILTLGYMTVQIGWHHLR